MLERLVRSNPWLMEVLVAARDVDPPDWLVGGDVLRGLVWDHLHGRPPGGPRDVDLAFFDPARLDPARDAEVEQACGPASPASPGTPRTRPPSTPGTAGSSAARSPR